MYQHVRQAGNNEPLIRIISDLIKNRRIEDENLFIIEGLWAYEKIIKSSVRIKALHFVPILSRTTACLRWFGLLPA